MITTNPQRKNRNRLRQIVTVFFLMAFFNSAVSQEPELALTSVISGLNQPMQIVNAGDGTNRLFVVLREGQIKVYDESHNFIGDFLTVSDVDATNGTENGLLSMAFHPEYANSSSPFFGYFFVYYTSSSSSSLVIARYQVSSGNSNIADDATKAIVLSIPTTGADIHSGGTIHFDENDFLYLTTGDGGTTPESAQDGTSLLGKMLRIQVTTSTYSIPADNPYIGDPNISDEIWAMGLRNPFRWSFDRQTGDMWIADVGEATWEEINFRAANSTGGINYGWQCYEGNAPFNLAGCGSSSDYVFPIYDYTTGAGASVTGGTVYRGTTVSDNASLRGYYLAADYITGNFYKIKSDGPGVWTTYIQPALQRRIVNFGEAENGELYAVSLRDNANDPLNGFISQITVINGALPVVLADFTANQNNGVVHLNWKTSLEQNLQQFEIEYGIDGTNFIRAGIVPALNSASGSDYTFSHEPSSTGRLFYRLKMLDFDGQYKYSNIIIMSVSRSNKSFVQPSVITSGVINVFLDNSFNTLELISINGAVLLKQNIKGRTGKLDIPVPFVTTGTYIVQLRNNETSAKQLILIR